MKKIVILFTMLMLVLSAQVVYAERPIKVFVGGTIVLSDCSYTTKYYGDFEIPPISVEVRDGRIMLPLRVIFEKIGAQVKYDGATSKITATKNGHTVELTVGSNIMYVDDEEKVIDTPAYIKHGKTYIPVRACAEAFGLEVEWDDFTRTVKIIKEVSLPTRGYTYDERGNLIQYDDIVNIGRWIKYAYDDNNNEIYVEYSNGAWCKKEYNEYNEIIVEESNDGIKRYTYEDGYKKRLDFQGNNADYPSYSVDFFYDSYGNLTYMKYGSHGWNANGWKKYEYDEMGNVISYEDSDGNKEKFEYNSIGKVTRKELKHATYIYIYDEFSRLKNVTWGNGDILNTYIYDERGNLIREEDSYNQFKNYEYDDNGNVIREEDHNGNWTEYAYDENANMISKKFSSGTSNTYEYDENGNLISNKGGIWGGTDYIIIKK